jgi:hypothetical protein
MEFSVCGRILLRDATILVPDLLKVGLDSTFDGLAIFMLKKLSFSDFSGAGCSGRWQMEIKERA